MFALMMSAAPSTFLLSCELEKIASSASSVVQNCTFFFFENKLYKLYFLHNHNPLKLFFFFLKSESIFEWS